jgi:hypothetical protein
MRPQPVRDTRAHRARDHRCGAHRQVCRGRNSRIGRTVIAAAVVMAVWFAGLGHPAAIALAQSATSAVTPEWEDLDVFANALLKAGFALEFISRVPMPTARDVDGVVIVATPRPTADELAWLCSRVAIGGRVLLPLEVPVASTDPLVQMVAAGRGTKVEDPGANFRQNPSLPVVTTTGPDGSGRFKVVLNLPVSLAPLRSPPPGGDGLAPKVTNVLYSATARLTGGAPGPGGGGPLVAAVQIEYTHGRAIVLGDFSLLTNQMMAVENNRTYLLALTAWLAEGHPRKILWLGAKPSPTLGGSPGPTSSPFAKVPGSPPASGQGQGAGAGGLPRLAELIKALIGMIMNPAGGAKPDTEPPGEQKPGGTLPKPGAGTPAGQKPGGTLPKTGGGLLAGSGLGGGGFGLTELLLLPLSLIPLWLAARRRWGSGSFLDEAEVPTKFRQLVQHSKEKGDYAEPMRQLAHEVARVLPRVIGGTPDTPGAPPAPTAPPASGAPRDRLVRHAAACAALHAARNPGQGAFERWLFRRRVVSLLRLLDHCRDHAQPAAGRKFLRTYSATQRLLQQIGGNQAHGYGTHHNRSGGRA